MSPTEVPASRRYRWGLIPQGQGQKGGPPLPHARSLAPSPKAFLFKPIMGWVSRINSEGRNRIRTLKFQSTNLNILRIIYLQLFRKATRQTAKAQQALKVF